METCPILLWCLLCLGTCWGPLFHQSIARQFSYEQFPDLTEQQRNAFVLGSMYADGVDKRFSHTIPNVMERLSQVRDRDSEIYWFLLGIVAHLAPDTFAHAGKSRSFIVARGYRHYFSEAVVDSLARHIHNPAFIRLTDTLRNELVRMGLKPSWKFEAMYAASFVASKLPLYRMLPFIEQDPCPKANYEMALCTFMRHYDAMMQALREAFARVGDPEFNDVRLREISTRLVWDVGCCECEDGVVNETSAEEQWLVLHPVPIFS